MVAGTRETLGGTLEYKHRWNERAYGFASAAADYSWRSKSIAYRAVAGVGIEF
jgi:hypothetical protein